MSAGEDRWTTKFLLKEHTEAYGERYDKPVGDQPADEEWILMRDYILMPHLLTVVQRNIDQLSTYKGVLKDLYIRLAEEIASAVEKDMFRLRRELTRRNIHVDSGEQEDIVLNYMFKYRGYSGNFAITREEMRAQMGIRLTRYVAELLQKMKK